MAMLRLRAEGRLGIGRFDVRRLGFGALALVLVAIFPLHAQTPQIDALRGKIFDARMAKQMFGNGLKFCDELDGTNFFYLPRNRVLKLEEYHRSLEGLVSAQIYNLQTRRPWNEADANARWEQAKKQALTDKQNCELVATLPELERRLEELQQKAATTGK